MNQALHTLLWLAALWFSLQLVFMFVGAAGLVNMFPEGRRWWLPPAQYGSLALFAAVTHFHPF